MHLLLVELQVYYEQYRECSGQWSQQQRTLDHLCDRLYGGTRQLCRQQSPQWAAAHALCTAITKLHALPCAVHPVGTGMSATPPATVAPLDLEQRSRLVVSVCRALLRPLGKQPFGGLDRARFLKRTLALPVVDALLLPGYTHRLSHTEQRQDESENLPGGPSCSVQSMLRSVEVGGGQVLACFESYPVRIVRFALLTAWWSEAPLGDLHANRFLTHCLIPVMEQHNGMPPCCER
jgi:hypothetical protein